FFCVSLVVCYVTPPCQRYTLFPYTTLFRSKKDILDLGGGHRAVVNTNVIDRSVEWVCPGCFSGTADGCIRAAAGSEREGAEDRLDRKSTRLNSSHGSISYAVFCLKKNTPNRHDRRESRRAGALVVPVGRDGHLHHRLAIHPPHDVSRIRRRARVLRERVRLEDPLR